MNLLLFALNFRHTVKLISPTEFRFDPFGRSIDWLWPMVVIFFAINFFIRINRIVNSIKSNGIWMNNCQSMSSIKCERTGSVCIYTLVISLIKCVKLHLSIWKSNNLPTKSSDMRIDKTIFIKLKFNIELESAVGCIHSTVWFQQHSHCHCHFGEFAIMRKSAIDRIGCENSFHFGKSLWREQRIASGFRLKRGPFLPFPLFIRKQAIWFYFILCLLYFNEMLMNFSESVGSR